MTPPKKTVTNVPENIRAEWTDAYKLFDKFYLMENSETAWKEFWFVAREMYEKHTESRLFAQLSVMVADYIGERMKAEYIAKNS